MDNAVVLRCPWSGGGIWQVAFAPEQGMALTSWRWGERELMAEGHGCLVGPHYGLRHPSVVASCRPPADKTEVTAADPLAQGIARYVPWRIVTATETEVQAELSGKDMWQDSSLSQWQGQSFLLKMGAELTPEALHIQLSIVSDADSLVGLDYSFCLPKGAAGCSLEATARSAGDKSTEAATPLVLPLDNQPHDMLLWPWPDPLQGQLILVTPAYRLRLTSRCCCQENCWYLRYTPGQDYVTLQPLSSQDPQHPNLTVSSLQISIALENSV